MIDCTLAFQHIMRISYIPLLLLCMATQRTEAAAVEVDQFFQGTTKIEEVIAPAQFKAIPIGPLKIGDQLAIQIDASNKFYNDITACIATEAEARAYTPKSACRGQLKSRTPIVLRDQVQADATYYLILDNSYANLVRKTLSAKITMRRSLTPEEIRNIRTGFQSIQSKMTSTFENSDFDIYLKPCGQSNAFSDSRTAGITLCSELMHDLLVQRNLGALVAVLLHEYGHSLMNRWGEPGSSEEDMADQFATALLLRDGDSGRRLLQEWIAYWLRQDSRAEAQYQLQRGDTHTLSVQRARNIQNAMNFPEEFVRRWNKMLYRHMTRGALTNIIAKPAKADDLELAQEALRQK